MSEEQILTLPDWAVTPPEVFKLTDEQADEVMALFEPVREKLLELGAPATFQFVRELVADGGSLSQGWTVSCGAGKYTAEGLAYSMIAEGGLQVLLDNLEALLHYGNQRSERFKETRIIVPGI